LEVCLESELRKQYPNLDILFNDKTILNSELDIYIPSLRLAFELNGILHYKPIYGTKKLLQIKKNDRFKKLLCKEKDIKLVIFKVNNNDHQKYLNLIKDFINTTPTRR
jgi:hypothetical protein